MSLLFDPFNFNPLSFAPQQGDNNALAAALMQKGRQMGGFLDPARAAPDQSEPFRMPSGTPSLNSAPSPTVAVAAGGVPLPRSRPEIADEEPEFPTALSYAPKPSAGSFPTGGILKLDNSTATAPPIDALPAAPPSMLERIGKAFSDNSGLLIGLGAGLAGAPSWGSGIARGLQGAQAGAQADQASQVQNLTFNTLVKKGVDPEIAKAAVANPEILKQILPEVFGTKDRTETIKEFEYARQGGFKGSFQDWIAQKRGGAGEYGLQPIYGVDKDGNPTIVQLGKSGEAVQSKLPEGIRIAKEPIKVDAGTHYVLIDPVTRQPISTIKKEVADVEAEKEKGSARGTAEANLPSALAQSEQALKTIEQIRNHPGKQYGVGVAGVLPGIPGTQQKDFVSLVDQAKGQTFLQAFQSLKGGGAITEVEGKKATDAIGRLDRAQSKEGFDAALKDLEDVIRAGMERAKTRAGKPATQSAPPAAAPAVRGKSSFGVPWSVN